MRPSFSWVNNYNISENLWIGNVIYVKVRPKGSLWRNHNPKKTASICCEVPNWILEFVPCILFLPREQFFKICPTAHCAIPSSQGKKGARLQILQTTFITSSGEWQLGCLRREVERERERERGRGLFCKAHGSTHTHRAHPTPPRPRRLYDKLPPLLFLNVCP